MGTFLVYIIESSFCMTLFYLFFKLLMSKDTFHAFNRKALLGFLLFSWIVPLGLWLFPALGIAEQATTGVEHLPAMALIEMVNTGKVAFPWMAVLLSVYVLGILCFIALEVYSFLRLLFFLRNSERQLLEGGVVLVKHDKRIAPFSWMKFIVISTADLTEDGDKILTHEMAHIRKRHSWDILLVELSILFHWFNPAAWLLKRELRNIHEYEADECVLNQGIDAKQYQLLLIKKAVGTVRFNSLSNSFNHSKLKKRITMMLKEKSNPWAKLKCLCVLPLAAIAISAFAHPEVSNRLNEISDAKVNDLSAFLKEEQPEKKQSPDKVKVSVVTVDKENSPLVLVNGEEVSMDILTAIDPARIESIHVVKGEEALEKYGEKGKKGVVEVALLAVDKTNTDDKKRVKRTISHTQSLNDGITLSTVKTQEMRADSLVGTSGNIKLIVKKGAVGKQEITFDTLKEPSDMKITVDGKAISLEEMKNIDSNSIETISVNTLSEEDVPVVKIKMKK